MKTGGQGVRGRAGPCNEISKPSSNIDAVEIKLAIHSFDRIHCDVPEKPVALVAYQSSRSQKRREESGEIEG